MAKNKGKKRGLLLGEIRIQRRVGKDGSIATHVRQAGPNGESLDYFEMAGMMALGEHTLYSLFDNVDED